MKNFQVLFYLVLCSAILQTALSQNSAIFGNPAVNYLFQAQNLQLTNTNSRITFTNVEIGFRTQGSVIAAALPYDFSSVRGQFDQDFSLRAIPKTSQVLVVLIMHNAVTWTKVTTSLIISGRTDIFVGTFIFQPTQFIASTDNTVLTENFNVCKLCTASITSRTCVRPQIMKAFISGMRSSRLSSPNSPVTVGINQFNLDLQSFIIQLTAASSMSIEWIQITILVVTDPLDLTFLESSDTNGRIYTIYGPSTINPISQLSITTISVYDYLVPCKGGRCPSSRIKSTSCLSASGSIVSGVCYLCLAGQTISNDQCIDQTVVCGANQVPSGNQCVCKPGYIWTSSSKSSCILCPGTSAPSDNLMQCLCPANSNQILINGVCVNCPANTVANQNLIKCFCQAPNYVIKGGLACGQCLDTETYNQVTKQCSCSSDSILVSGKCTKCPQYSSSNAQRTECACFSSFLTALDGSCLCTLPKTVIGNVCQCPNFMMTNTNGNCLCPSGSYFTGSQCISCGLNFVFNDATKQCNCNSPFITVGLNCQCPSGQILVNGGCKSCSTNYIYNPNSSQCECQSPFVLSGQNCQCPANSYQSGNTCQFCPQNFIVNSGANRCDCNPPFALVGSNCQCPNGQIALNGGCQSCPPNFVINSGANRCDCNAPFTLVGLNCQCPSGQIAINGGCQSCPINFVINVGANRCDCNSPFTLVGSNCQCPNGQIALNGGCQPCPPNFVANVGANRCDCNAPFVQVGSNCQCPNGQIALNGGCQTCPPNFVVNLGANRCDCNSPFILVGSNCQCPNGQISVNGGCQTCPPNFVVNAAANRCDCNPPFALVGSNCQCPSGQIAINGGCQSCPPNFVINVGANRCDCNSPFTLVGSNCQCPGNSINSGNTCVFCTNGKVPNTNLDACICPTDQVQLSDGSCTKCVGGSIYNPTKRVCQCPTPFLWDNSAKQCFCPQNSIQVGSNCVACQSGKIPNSAGTACVCASPNVEFPDGSCKTCPPNAQYNPQTKDCICPSGYSWNVQTNTCASGCPDGSTLNSGGLCQCTVPKVSTTGSCLACNQNSAIVSTNNFCLCKNGFLNSGINDCFSVTCPAKSYAILKDDNAYCLCFAGFAAIGGTCQQCPANSLVSLSKKSCICPSGFTFNSASNICEQTDECKNSLPARSTFQSCGENEASVNMMCFTCPANSSPNSAKNECVCSTGYYMKAVQGAFVCLTNSCPANAKVAIQNGETICKCPDNSIFYNGMCAFCPSNAIVSPDGKQCMCKRNAKLTAGRCVATGCPENSRYAGLLANGNPDCRCTGNYIMSSDMQCVQCKLNEVANTATKTCVCSVGYTRGADGNCASTCSANTIPVVEGLLISCICDFAKGYVQTANMGCQKCPQNSIPDKSMTKCYCVNGYQWHQDLKSCSPLCKAPTVYNPSNSTTEEYCVCPLGQLYSQGFCIGATIRATCPMNSKQVICGSTVACACLPTFIQQDGACISTSCPQDIATFSDTLKRCVCKNVQANFVNGKCVVCVTNEVFNGNQCICANGYVRTASGCQICPYSQTVINGLCRCPDGTGISNNQCVACPAYSSQVNNECKCNSGYELDKNNNCIINPCDLRYSVAVVIQNGIQCFCLPAYANKEFPCISVQNCPSGSAWNPDIMKCVCTAPNSYYVCGACRQCPVNEVYGHGGCICANGFSRVNGRCIRCDTNSYFDGYQCICRSGYYGNGNLEQGCSKCHDSCSYCFGSNSNQCYSCRNSAETINAANTCVVNTNCQIGSFYSDPEKKCKYCVKNCRYCRDEASCDTCASGFGIYMVRNGNVAHISCEEICGDGIKMGLPCDDGNNRGGDGCSANCMIESGWNCYTTGPNSPSTCQRVTVPVQPASLFVLTHIYVIGSQLIQGVQVTRVPAGITDMRNLLWIEVIQCSVPVQISITYFPGTRAMFAIVFTITGFSQSNQLSYRVRIKPSLSGFYSEAQMRQSVSRTVYFSNVRVLNSFPALPSEYSYQYLFSRQGASGGSSGGSSGGGQGDINIHNNHRVDLNQQGGTTVFQQDSSQGMENSKFLESFFN